MTLNEYKSTACYTRAIILTGNEKLQDTEKYVYMQFNLPALKTCPFASDGCKKFCYACTGNHNFSNVKNARENAFRFTQSENFVNDTIDCISAAATLARYTKRAPVLRIHESGDFYNQSYANNWIDILYVLMTKDINVHAHFYTKSFIYFLNLDLDHSTKFRALLENGFLVVNLSIDNTTNALQLSRAAALRKLYPMINTYHVIESVSEINPDNVCRCTNCADCGKCNLTTGNYTYCAIH